MAKPRMDLSAFVGKLLEEQDGDVLREGIRVLSQALMETEVAGEHRYLWVDATYHKVRVDGRVLSQATVVAVGVTTEGDRRAARHRCRSVGGPCFLDGVSPQPREARPQGRAPGDLRRPRGIEAGDQHGPFREHVAALSGAFHAESARHGAAGRA